jgi:glycosyltransferase involved in cell wall biosynthesis
MKVSVIMPVFNQEKLVEESFWNAYEQNFPDKEILIQDDCSTDRTYEICSRLPARVHRNNTNLGLGHNLNELVAQAKGEYIIILCGDDVFTDKRVISDMVELFEENPKVGVVGRYYYQYLNGYPGAVMTIRGDIFTSSCQPSGIGFRKSALTYGFTNKIFVEIPLAIKQLLDLGWEYNMLRYDTIAARLHPGLKGNAATNPSYYKTNPQQSPTLNWLEVTGKPLGMYLGLIQIKNRYPAILLSEIRQTIRINKKCLLNIGFWFCVLTALIVPGCILRRLSNWYRHRITRRFVKIIKRL